MVKELLTGNEAIARGAYEGGVSFAAGYPGTPSTEILETIAKKYRETIYAEWSPNEKVAFEVAVGASHCGARVLVTMKHVGLNVAADPLTALAYVGVVGGFVVTVADDPSMHSSQNEQDTRHYAKLAKVPLLEPSDSEEAKEFVKLALQISEDYNTPVILRTTTRIAHSRGLVNDGEPLALKTDLHFTKEPSRYFISNPIWAKKIRQQVEERLDKLTVNVDDWAVNQILWNDKNFGIITSGVVYQYVREVFPNASVLKIGMPFPFPDKQIKEFANKVGKLFIIEELDNFLEEHIKSLGIFCHGKDVIPRIGELSPDILYEVLGEKNYGKTIETAVLPDIPIRPPTLCPGCPHRGLFYVLGKLDVIVTGDIGCYALGASPPLSRMDTILCMGGGITMAHGLDKALRKNLTTTSTKYRSGQKIVGIMGDSTFFHSGITGLLDVAYNKSGTTIIVADNRITAMTGHQENPGSGQTLMGEQTVTVSIEDFGRACGIKNILTVDPYNIPQTTSMLKEATNSPEAYLIVARKPCPLYLHKKLGNTLSVNKVKYKINNVKCKKCEACLQLGCPAIEKIDAQIQINDSCAGCGICATICPVKSIDKHT
ncbi:MAG: indolepyruvate ferredoxin oxidoreductase subunit alpha [Planctomycetaceae bacterium]|jgi:indolepyruvate ferredoxin oxidoreductase alpha subunit|nr:indolepyruvate ferredoxin oxidoreductase subunit alpha [Planctomycetaceae bacterium]